jgi:hypothetical protein
LPQPGGPHNTINAGLSEEEAEDDEEADLSNPRNINSSKGIAPNEGSDFNLVNNSLSINIIL